MLAAHPDHSIAMTSGLLAARKAARAT